MTNQSPTTTNPWKAPSTRVDEFLSKAQPSETARRACKARLIFAMDATASRAPTWDSAMKVQGDMFMSTQSLGTLSIQLMYFRGWDECKASRWVDNPRDLMHLMTGVTCKAGHTQISRVLQRALQEQDKDHINALIFVGDAFEEDLERCVELAQQLGEAGTPIYFFREGSNKEAHLAFDAMTRASKGAHFTLDAHSTENLKNLLSAVATFAVGGLAALEKLGTSEAKELLRLTSALRAQQEEPE